MECINPRSMTGKCVETHQYTVPISLGISHEGLHKMDEVNSTITEIWLCWYLLKVRVSFGIGIRKRTYASHFPLCSTCVWYPLLVPGFQFQVCGQLGSSARMSCSKRIQGENVRSKGLVCNCRLIKKEKRTWEQDLIQQRHHFPSRHPLPGG